MADSSRGRVAGKVALVTGAFGGIGKSSAEALAREGAVVVAADVKPDGPAYDQPSIRYRQLDVRSDEAWRALVADVVREHGRLDILASVAGITAYEALDEAQDEVWHEVVAVNQTGLMYGLRAVLPVMMGQARGSIVTISSIFGLAAVEGIAAYHASKGAVTMMARNAAVTYARHGIRVNSIHPGLIDTPMARARDMSGQGRTIDLTPMGRIGHAEEVANGVLFLASDEASYITGVQLPIDGGYLAQ